MQRTLQSGPAARCNFPDEQAKDVVQCRFVRGSFAQMHGRAAKNVAVEVDERVCAPCGCNQRNVDVTNVAESETKVPTTSENAARIVDARVPDSRRKGPG